MSEHKYLTEEQIGDFYLSHPRTVGPMHSDILALRAELKAAQEERDTYRLAMLGVNDTYKECKAELDRMRKALEDIASGKGYPISDAMRALNPQLAQSETPKKFRSGYPAYTCRHCGSNHREHGESEECPLATQPEKP